MTISKDLSHLPPAAAVPASEGFQPLVIPAVGNVLADAWYEQYGRDDNKPMSVEGAIFRHSWAAMCSRRIAYEMLGYTKSDPPSKADIWRMGLGTMVHEALQRVTPWGQSEAAVSIQREGYFTAGTVDIILDFEPQEEDEFIIPGHRVAVEVKTIGGYAFKLAASEFRGPAEGPRRSAVVQASLNAVGAEADEARVVYFSMENLSPSLTFLTTGEYAQFLAEWVIHDFREVAEEELSRIDRIVELVKNRILPDRSIPDGEIPPGARIVDVGGNGKKPRWQLTRHGAVASTGTTWHCDYCSFRSQCRTDGPGRVAIPEASVKTPAKRAPRAKKKG